MQGLSSMNAFLRFSATANATSQMGGGMGPGVMRSTPNQSPAAPPSTGDARNVPPASSSSPAPQTNQAEQPEKPSAASGDTVRLSQQAQKANQDNTNPTANPELSRAERQVLQQLQARDQEVKTHEQAHIAAGGQYVNGGASYSYRIGPDGKMYAVGGEVSIDVSPVPGDPEATIEKAQAIQRAANAPAEPSAQDSIIAAKARAMETEARTKLRQQEDDATTTTASASETNGIRIAGVATPDTTAATETDTSEAPRETSAAAAKHNPASDQASHPGTLLQAAQNYSFMAVPPTSHPTAGISIHA